MNLLIGHNTIIDLLTAWVALIGFTLFLYWWVRTGRATPGFVYVTILLFVIFFENLVETYMKYIKGPLWTLNSVIMMLTVVTLVLHMFYRVVSITRKTSQLRQQISKEAKQAPKYVVLVVEDDMQIPAILHDFFSRCYPLVQMLVATNPTEAMEIVEGNREIDVLLCDMDFRGDKSGLDVCDYVKPRIPHATLIGMTGYPSQYSPAIARKRGFDDYFIKPFRLKDLNASLTYYLSRNERWRELIERN